MFDERYKRASKPKIGSKSNSTVAKKFFQEKDSFDFATKDTNRFSPTIHNVVLGISQFSQLFILFMSSS